MRCRRIVDGKIVWFGSKGLQKAVRCSDETIASDNLFVTENMVALFYNKNDKHDNYADKQQGVADSVTQRLSVIRGELWYKIGYGIPLLEKVKSKSIIDANVIQTIVEHPDVNTIKDFNSHVDKHHYHCSMTIVTLWGDVNLQM